MNSSKKEAQNVSVNDMDYLAITKDIKESPRIQKTEYIRQQMLKRREMEDELMAKLMQEQSVIDSFRSQINEGLDQTEELSRYNSEFRENMAEQIYSLHGISKDKLEGMQECKNAFRRGYSIILFLLSAALTVLCGALHGFQSDLCLLMLAMTGMQGAMLAQDNSLNRYPILRLINRVLFPLIFPLMMTMFICFEMNFVPYDILPPYIAMAGIIILLLSAVPYFIYDPYRGMGKHMRAARAEIKIVEKVAKKEVSKNQRIRIREEKKELAKQAKEDRRQERIAKKDARKNARREKKKDDKNEIIAASPETESNEIVTVSPETESNETATVSPETESNETVVEEADIVSEKTAENPAEIGKKEEPLPETRMEETVKPEPPKKRRVRKKNPVIDITEGAQNLAVKS